jgi:hypothetical protein
MIYVKNQKGGIIVYASSVSAATYLVPASKTSKSDIDKDIKALKVFKDQLNKQLKAVKKSRMDEGFKQDAVKQIGWEKNSADNKIQQLTVDKQSLNNDKSGKSGDVAKLVAVAYGVAYWV